MAGKGGGAWKVAYADFVTAMMAFFLVMWITSQSQKVKEAVAHHFNDPLELTGDAEDGANSPQLRQPIRPKPPREKGNPPKGDDPEAPPTRNPRMLTLRETERPRTAASIYFDGDGVELDDGAKQRLQRIIPVLLGKPQKIEIRGHTSRAPLAENCPFADAWQLSYARCQATLQYLVSQGISPERIRMSQAAGFEPLTTRIDGDSQARNPRVEVYVLSETVEDFIGTREEREGLIDTLSAEHH